MSVESSLQTSQKRRDTLRPSTFHQALGIPVTYARNGSRLEMPCQSMYQESTELSLQTRKVKILPSAALFTVRPYSWVSTGVVSGVSEVTSPEDLLGCCVKEQGDQAKWTCNICYQFSHRSRQNVRNHVESKHYPSTFQYTCPSCDKICYTMRALEVHKSSAHRQQSSY